MAEETVIWLVGEAAQCSPDDTGLAKLITSLLPRKEATDPAVTRIAGQLQHSSDLLGWSYQGEEQEDGQRAWLFRVKAEVFFARSEVRTWVQSKPNPKLSPVRARFFAGSPEEFVSAEDAVAQLKVARISPDDWPEIYKRNAERRGVPTVVTRTEQATHAKFLFEFDAHRFEPIVLGQGEQVPPGFERYAGPGRMGRIPIDLFMLRREFGWMHKNRIKHSATQRRQTEWRARLETLVESDPQADINLVLQKLSDFEGYDLGVDGNLLLPGDKSVKRATVANALASIHKTHGLTS